jgi:hypothetical protein
MGFQESYVSHGLRSTVFTVLDMFGEYHEFKTASAANAMFPGAFDVADSDDD